MARTESLNPQGPRVIKVFMVELKIELPDTPTITFFGSKKAIFEYFGNKMLGIAYTSSRTKNFREFYENARCRIYEGDLITLASRELSERRAKEGREAIPSKWSDSAFNKE